MTDTDAARHRMRRAIHRRDTALAGAQQEYRPGQPCMRQADEITHQPCIGGGTAHPAQVVAIDRIGDHHRIAEVVPQPARAHDEIGVMRDVAIGFQAHVACAAGEHYDRAAWMHGRGNQHSLMGTALQGQIDQDIAAALGRAGQCERRRQGADQTCDTDPFLHDNLLVSARLSAVGWQFDEQPGRFLSII